MKKFAIFLVCVSSFLFASEDPSTLFEKKCSMCHLKTRPADVSKLVAPPIMGVMRHVKMTYKTKEEAVNFIVDYVFNPSKEKAVCMPQKIKRFGLMPSQKGAVSKEEVQKIANWLYENFPKKGFGGFNHKMMPKEPGCQANTPNK